MTSFTLFMFLKCSATGKIFFSPEEAKDHAEALGKADFEEVSPDTLCWVSRESGKPFYSRIALEQYKQRVCRGGGEEFEEITLQQLKVLLT
jgi:hypothetical protein